MYPQQYQEFLDFLDSNPEYLHDMRVRLLTPELIALPEQFAQLVATVTDIAERFATFVDTTNNRLTTMNDNIARLNGSDLERRAREIILNIAKDELGLTRGHILLAQGKDTAPAFENTMTQAEDKGIIAEEQVSDVMVADLIIRARRNVDRKYVHAVFEVSRTIGNEDIERAAKRAATVAQATGEETIAAVIGQRIQPPQLTVAAATGVQVLLPAILRQEQDNGALAA